MDALVRLHETHTGGAAKVKEGLTTAVYPLNTTTLAARLPILNGSNTKSVEKWISTIPTQMPVVINKFTKQSQFGSAAVPTTQTGTGKTEAGTLSNTPTAVTKAVKDGTPRPSNLQDSKQRASTSASSPSILDELNKIPDRPEKRKRQTGQRNPGH